MARRKKTASGALVPTPARLVQPLTKAQGKLLDTLIDDPTLTPVELCEIAGVPAYTWRRALRSPAFASALLDAQRSALDASRLSRTQAAIEKAQTSPAFARLCFQIDGSIKDAPTLVQQFNQTTVNMPVSQLRRKFDAGEVVEIPDLNYQPVQPKALLTPLLHSNDSMELEGVLPKAPTIDDLSATHTIPLPISSSEVRSQDHAQHSEVRGEQEYTATKYEVDVHSTHSDVLRSDTHSEPVRSGRAWTVHQVEAGQVGSMQGDQGDDYDLL